MIVYGKKTAKKALLPSNGSLRWQQAAFSRATRACIVSQNSVAPSAAPTNTGISLYSLKSWSFQGGPTKHRFSVYRL